jgi:peptidoglycan/LPS O-acetylase OafA/YrhL
MPLQEQNAMSERTAEEELLAHQFPVLDSLRAVGALAVLTTHAGFWAGDYTRLGVRGMMLARLDVGVAIFFVLSGFLLARPYLARAAIGQSAPATGRYLWKRFIRIAPVYVLTVVVTLSLIGANRDRGLRDWTITLLLGNTFVQPTLPDGLTQMWSLAVEVTFYLVLPLLMLVGVGRLRRLRAARVLVLVGAMIAVNVAWTLVGVARVAPVTNGDPGEWLPSYLMWFGLGILLALVHVLHQQGRWQRLTAPLVSLAQQPGSCWAMVAGLFMVAATPLAGPSMFTPPSPGESLAKTFVYALIGGLLVLTGVFPRSGSRYARFFGHPLARHLGFISYGIFCLHLPVLHFIVWSTGWPLFAGRLFPIWALALVLSVISAEIVYRCLEVPAMRLRSLGRPSADDTRALTKGTSIR